MSRMPRVSVVVTAYNVAPFLRQALESALSQTATDIEVVVVDDGSSDEPDRVAGEFADPRLRLVRQDNQGASAARNRGVSETSAPYVAFLDGDDYWGKDKLEQQASLLDRHPEIDLVFTLCGVVSERGTSLAAPQRPPAAAISFAELLCENYVRNGSSVMVRRSALEAAGGFDASFAACNDYEAWLRIALLRERNVLCLQRYLTFYRRRAGQITDDWRTLERSFLQLLDKMEDRRPEEVRRARPAALRNMYRYFSLIAYKNGESMESLRLLAISFRSQPAAFCLDLRSWLVAAGSVSRLVLGPAVYGRIERPALRLWTRLVQGGRAGAV